MSLAIVQDSTRTEASERGGHAFFSLFLVSLVLISIPVKNFAYALPPLYVLLMLLGFDTASGARTLLLAALATALSCISILVDSLRGQETNLPGVFMGLLTFSPLFIMAAQRLPEPIDDDTFDRIRRLVAWYVILQAGIGLVQLAVSGNPDAVTGTLGLLDFRSGGITIVQLYFGFLMLGMVLFLMLDPSTWLVRIGIAAGLFVSAISQSGHQCAFFLASLVGFAVLQSRRIVTVVAAGAVATVLVASVLLFDPGTIDIARSWYVRTVSNPDSPKRLALESARRILSDPKNLLLGTGLGQFSSRAALITSGEFLRIELPNAVVAQSDYYQSLRPGLDEFKRMGEGSAISKPYFSMLTLPVELGVPVFLGLAFACLAALGRCVRLMYSPKRHLAQAGMLGAAGLGMMLLCCCVENYLEFPQAVFLPYLLFMAGLSWALHTSSPREAPSR